MKKMFYLFLFISTAVTTFATGHPAVSVKSDPRATFDKMWVDYDITDNGVRGMRIHLKFTAYGMKGMDAYAAVYFEYKDEKTGTLRDKNGKYASTDGDVALYKAINADYDPADYNDLQLFMPYDELDLDPGSYELSMDIKLIYKAGGLISKLTTYDFEFTKPGSTNSGNSAKTPDAKFTDLTVDYDVTDNGVKGMRIHAKFSVYNMKNVDCYLAIYFEKKNGDKIYSNNTDYRSKSGQLAIYKSLTPGYDEADYNDIQLFMPYSEFSLGTGKFDLKMDADVIYKNGDLLKHLNYHDFWFQQ